MPHADEVHFVEVIEGGRGHLQAGISRRDMMVTQLKFMSVVVIGDWGKGHGTGVRVKAHS